MNNRNTGCELDGINAVHTRARRPVNCLTQFPNGFCYAIHNALYVFEKDKTYMRFMKKTVIKIPIKIYADELYEIIQVSINVVADTVIVTAKHNQIYIGMPFATDTMKLQFLEFKVLGESLHTFSIIDLAVCLWKTIVLSAGK